MSPEEIIGCGILRAMFLYVAALEPSKRSEEKAMNTEYIVSGLIAVLLLVYLLYALLKPEKF